jgi:hypothetical protein
MAGGDGALTIKARRGHAVAYRRFLADILPGLAGALVVRLACLLALLACANPGAALVDVLAGASHIHAAKLVIRDLLLVPVLAFALPGRAWFSPLGYAHSEPETHHAAQEVATGGESGQVG